MYKRNRTEKRNEFKEIRKGETMSRGQNRRKNNQTEPPQVVPQPPQTEPPIPLLPEDIEESLADFAGKGFKVMLHRSAPLHCSGFLETYPLDQPLTLEAIKESWGGRDFILKIKNPQGKIVQIRTVKIADVPRVEGIPLSKHIEYADGGRTVKNDPQTKMIEVMQAQLQQSQTAHNDLLNRMMEQTVNHAQQLRDADREDRSNAAEQSSPMDTMKETFELFQEMKNFTDKHAPQGEGGNGEQGIDYMQLAKMFMDQMDERKSQVAEASKPRALALPGTTQQTPAQAPAAIATVEPHATPEPPQTATATPAPADEPEEEIPLEEELADLGPEDAAKVVAATLDRFSPEEQQTAMNALFGIAGNSLDSDQTGPDTNPVPTVQGGNHGETVKED